jgi:hypothetical protein
MRDHHELNTYIDIYCERTNIGLWNEPLNAITNISFFIAAFFVFLLMTRENKIDFSSCTLLILIIAIGMGSTLFHTFATVWAMLSDTLPILLFQLGFIYFYGQKVIGLNKFKALLLLAGFILLTALFGMLPEHLLNGSIGYIPAFLYLGGLGIYHLRAGKCEPFVLLFSTAAFCLSLSFRSVDMMVCEALPFGVHFMWHILNGLVLYLAVRGFILGQKPNP